VTGGSVVDFGAWSMIDGLGADGTATRVGLDVHDDVECLGPPLAGAVSAPRTGSHGWSPVVGTALLSADVASVRLTLTMEALSSGALRVNWDEAFIETATDTVFADGFESGSSGAWSGATP
jgi:hypothetical protein